LEIQSFLPGIIAREWINHAKGKVGPTGNPLIYPYPGGYGVLLLILDDIEFYTRKKISELVQGDPQQEVLTFYPEFPLLVSDYVWGGHTPPDIEEGDFPGIYSRYGNWIQYDIDGDYYWCPEWICGPYTEVLWNEVYPREMDIYVPTCMSSDYWYILNLLYSYVGSNWIYPNRPTGSLVR